MTRAVESGMPKLRIEESAARRQARIDRGEEVIVGVNRYRAGEDEPVEILDIDNAAVREQQVKRLEKIRRERDQKAVEAALTDLTKAAEDGGGNLLRSEEHTSELQSLMRISYAVFCLKKTKRNRSTTTQN